MKKPGSYEGYQQELEALRVTKEVETAELVVAGRIDLGLPDWLYLDRPHREIVVRLMKSKLQ